MIFWKHLRRFYRNERGATAIEYAVLGAIMATAIVAGVPAVAPIFDRVQEATTSALGGGSSEVAGETVSTTNNGNNGNGNGNNGNGNSEKECKGRGNQQSGGQGQNC